MDTVLTVIFANYLKFQNSCFHQIFISGFCSNFCFQRHFGNETVMTRQKTEKFVKFDSA